MKRIVWLSVFLGILLVSASFGAADCPPRGSIGISVGYMLQTPSGMDLYPMNLPSGGSNDFTQSGQMIGISYGLLDNLSLSASYGEMKFSGPACNILPSLGGGVCQLGGGQRGIGLMYGILQQKYGAPLSLAITGGYTDGCLCGEIPAYNHPVYGFTNATSMSMGMSSTSIGLNISKMFIPFIPYIRVAYETSNFEEPFGIYGKSWSDFQVSVGTTLFISRHAGIMVAVVSHSYTGAKDVPDPLGLPITYSNETYTATSVNVGLGFAL